MSNRLSLYLNRTLSRRPLRALSLVWRNDPLGLCIVTGAMLLLAAAGGRASFGIADMVNGDTQPIDALLLIALLLNLAMLPMAWWRRLERLATRAHIALHGGTAFDPLTGLLSRRAFLPALVTLIRDTERDGRDTVLLLLDLDGFRLVNEQHGHACGDLMLRGAAAILRDVLPGDHLCARPGRDLFVCAMPLDPARTDEVDRIVGDIRASLAAPFDLDGRRASISASIGIARSRSGNPDARLLLSRADLAIRAAKAAGGNRSIWFDDGMERAQSARRALETAMRDGISRDEIIPYFEPQTDLESGGLTGFEVRARWLDPAGDGFIAPDVFIPLAEEAELICDLALSVMRQAFIEARGWDHRLVVSVNVTPALLRDPWLAPKLVQLLVETRLPPERLEIELTEWAIVESNGLAGGAIASLKAQGVRVTLDDFGSGPSSLDNLRAVPFDRIKLDARFVATIADDRHSAAIVAAVVGLGAGLGIPVSAQGVDSSEIADRLRSIGCRSAQGPYFGEAIPADRVRHLLAERALLSNGRVARQGGTVDFRRSAP